MAPSWDPTVFPNLLDGTYDETSPLDTRYNCIAFAAGDDTQWWEPQPGIGYYWPPNIPRQYTVDAYVRAFGSVGYVPCGQDSSVEPDHDKIALYATLDHRGQATPEHAAIQLSDGRWKSKIGDFEDIAHDTLERLNSPDYGAPLLYLKRPRKP
jgi:hypothetical protein